MFDEGLYLLRKYEFVVTKQEIYKFGRSNNILKRIEDYPNGSIVYLLISCKDSTLHEKKILEIFRKKYENKLYHGSETFLGSLDSMKETIINYVSELMMNEGYKIVNQKILVERINEETNNYIPKRMQEIYNAEIINIPGINICHDDQNDNILNIKDKEIINIVNMDTKTNNTVMIDANIANSNIITNNDVNSINCICGIKATNQKEYTEHKIKCITITDKNRDRVCKYCKKILSNVFSCDRHMLTCKAIFADNKNIEPIIEIRQEPINKTVNNNSNKSKNNEVSDIVNSKFKCECGFTASYKSKYIRHLTSTRKCSYLLEREEKEKSKQKKDEKKQTFNNDFSKFLSDNMQNIEKNIMLVKNFITIYQSSNDKEKKLLSESNEYKKHKELIMKLV